MTNPDMRINMWKTHATAASGTLIVDNRVLAAFGSQQVGGTHFLMTDGAVKFVNENLDIFIYQNVGSRNEGGSIGDFAN